MHSICSIYMYTMHIHKGTVYAVHTYTIHIIHIHISDTYTNLNYIHRYTHLQYNIYMHIIHTYSTVYTYTIHIPRVPDIHKSISYTYCIFTYIHA